jgi:hypothetical protein
MGAAINVAITYLISRVKVQTLAIWSAAIAAIAPVLMATVKIDEIYWYAPFWAMLLSPVNADGKHSACTSPYMGIGFLFFSFLLLLNCPSS